MIAPRTTRKLRHRLRSLFARRKVESDLDREMQFHVEEQVDELAAAGMDRDQARRQALRNFGGITQIQEECRDRRRVNMIEDLGRDLAYAVRMLRKSPAFTFVAIASLAFGIGANTAIFGLVHHVVLRLLPVHNPEELVAVRGPALHIGSNTGPEALSYPMYRDFRARNSVFQDMFCRFVFDLHAGFGSGAAERATGEMVSGNYFQAVGVGAALGRLIGPDDDRTPGAHPVAVVSYGYWQRRLGSDASAVGRKIFLNGRPFTIIGVSAAGFDGLDLVGTLDVRIPIAMQPAVFPMYGRNSLEERRFRWVNVFGRLKPGVSIAQAQAGLQPLYRAILDAEIPAIADASSWSVEKFRASSIEVLPASQGRSSQRTRMERPLKMAMGAVAITLLIACLNIAGLLIARWAARQREVAVRLAMGAGRWRLVRQLFLESSLLAVVGCAAGFALVAPLQHWLMSYLRPGAPNYWVSGRPDWMLVLFGAGVTVVVALVFGLAPAWQATRLDLSGRLKDQGSALAGGARTGIRKVLVAAQLGLCVMLLAASALFLRSLVGLRGIDTGIVTHNVVSFKLDPRLNAYAHERTKLFHEDLLGRIRSLPGVEVAALARMGVLEGFGWDGSIGIEGYQAQPGEDMNPWLDAVSPGFFASLRIPLLAGRDFDARDEISIPPRPGEPPPYRVAIVSEAFAKKYFGAESPLGKRIGFGIRPEDKKQMEIVGVVKDVKSRSAREEAFKQVYFAFFEDTSGRGATYYVRTARESSTTLAEIDQVLRQIDPNLPMYARMKLDDRLDRALANERMLATLSTAFAILATLLAVTGLYGVMAYVVAGRTREIGLRMALGATTQEVLWLIGREVLLLSFVGIAAGLAAAAGIGQLIASSLYGVRPADPLSFAAAGALVAVAGALSGLIPAIRAARIDPLVALRHE